MSTFSFTEAKIAKLAGSDKTAKYYDTEVSGLALRITPTGTKTFFWIRWVNGRSTEKTLGRYPDMTVKVARGEAEKLNALRGEMVKEPTTPKTTLGYCLDHYLKYYAKDEVRTWQRMEKRFRKTFADWLGRNISSFKRAEMQDKMRELAAQTKGDGKSMANRLFDDLRAVINWAISNELFDGPNFAASVRRYPQHERDRFLQNEEVTRLSAAMQKEHDQDAIDFIWLCLFTGQRRGNVLHMRWSKVDLEAGTWDLDRTETKNKEPFRVMLTSVALEVLNSRKIIRASKGTDWVFESRRGSISRPMGPPWRAWKRILAEAKITDLRLHDLRRSLGSHLAMDNVNTPIIMKALGHKDVKVAQRYQRVSLSPVAEAMEKTTQRLKDLAQRGRK